MRLAPAARLLVLTGALVGFIAIARPAHADGSAAANETARALLNEGLGMRARGNLEGAIAKLRAAHALRATPVTAFELARAFAEHKDLVEARDVALSVKRIAASPDESRDAQAARRDAARLADGLKARIPSLTITLTGPGATSQPVVLLDGVVVPAAAIAEPQRLNPTKHHLVARVEGGPEAVADVELKDGENARVVLNVPAGGASVRQQGNATDDPAPSRDTILPKAAVWGGFSLAFVGAAVGTFAGIRALDQVSSLDSACSANRVCAPDHADDIASAKTSGNVATTAFVIAGIGAVIAGLGLLLWPHAEPAHARTQQSSAAR